MFEAIDLMDIENDRFTALLGKMKFDHDYEEEGLQHRLNTIAERRIRMDESEKFRAFTECGSLLTRIGEHGHGFISSIFHVRQENGVYRPEEFILLPVSGSRGNEFLFCTRICSTAPELP